MIRKIAGSVLALMILVFSPNLVWADGIPYHLGKPVHTQPVQLMDYKYLPLSVGSVEVDQIPFHPNYPATWPLGTPVEYVIECQGVFDVFLYTFFHKHYGFEEAITVMVERARKGTCWLSELDDVRLKKNTLIATITSSKISLSFVESNFYIWQNTDETGATHYILTGRLLS